MYQDPVAEVIVEAIEGFGWFVPNKFDIVCHAGKLEFLAWFVVNNNIQKSVFITVIDDSLMGSKNKSSTGPYPSDTHFSCSLADPECFEKFRVGLEGLWD